LKKEIEQNINDIGEKEEKIREIEAQLSDIARVADKINQHLRSMFSKEHIKIEATDKNKFKILRDGSEAKNLNSGEKTAFAFSYFLTRLEDKDFEQISCDNNECKTTVKIVLEAAKIVNITKLWRIYITMLADNSGYAVCLRCPNPLLRASHTCKPLSDISLGGFKDGRERDEI